MEKIMPDVRIYAGMHCFYAGIRNILLYHGYDFSEADIYFLCNAMRVQYVRDKNFIGIPHLGYAEVLSNFARKFPCEVSYSFDTDEGNLFDEIQNAIMNNKMVLLFMQSNYLDYNEIYTNNPGRGHVVILYGMDTDKRLAYVGDAFLLDFSGQVLTYSGKASLDEIQKGIWGYAWFDFNKDGIIGRDEIYNTAMHNLDKYINEDIEERAGFVGRQAYARMIEDFARLEGLDKDAFRIVTFNIYYYLKLGSIMHLINYLLRFMGEYKINQPDILDELNRIEMEWRKCLFNIYKTGLTFQKDNIGKIIKKASELKFQLEGTIRTFLTSSNSRLS